MNPRALLLAVLSLLPLPAGAGDLRTLASADQARGWDAVGRIDIGTQGFCTGTLIADDLVLTAAHCLYDKATGKRVEAQAMTFLAGWRNGRAEAYRNVVKAVAHPAYRMQAKPLDSVGTDLALLRLDHPIRLPQVQPFPTEAAPGTGDEVGIVSYAQDRSEAPSLQEVCSILAKRSDMLVLSCAVEFGASGAPVFMVEDGLVSVVSVVSAKAETEGRPVSLAVPLGETLATVKVEMDKGSTVTAGVRILSNGSGGAKFVKVAPSASP